MNKQILRIFPVVLIIAAVAQAFYFYPLMPERMASHFNASGVANGWMPKHVFFGSYGVLLGILLPLFCFLPRTILKFPDSMINLPNKEYWLVPERRQETANRIENYMVIAGCAVLALLVGVFQMVFEENLVPGSPLSPNIKSALVFFVMFMAGWLVSFVRSFSLPA